MNRIKQLRKEKEINQDVLANLLGLEVAAISKLETGRVPLKDEYILKLSAFFNVSSDYLLGKEMPNKKRLLPILGVVKAGYNYLAEENIIDYIEPGMKISDPENYFGLVVKGDSMAPLFLEGDYLLVHKQDGEYKSHDTCIVLINGNEATVKNIIKTDDGIELHPFNPCYPIKKYTFKEIKDLPIVILGKVVKLIRNLK